MTAGAMEDVSVQTLWLDTLGGKRARQFRCQSLDRGGPARLHLNLDCKLTRVGRHRQCAALLALRIKKGRECAQILQTCPKTERPAVKLHQH
jgi:hypothetical protein